MKVVALKIYKNQDTLLRVLVKSGLYSSLSECLRTAIWDFLKVDAQPDESGNLSYSIIEKNYPKQHLKDFEGPTVSITSKFPISMINQIDFLVHASNKYKNRSEFFRAALINFLVADSKLFSPFLLEKRSALV